MMYNDITTYILTVIVELLAACVNHSSEKYYIITYAGSLSISLSISHYKPALS